MKKSLKIILFSILYILGIISFFSDYFLPVSIFVIVILFILYKFKHFISFKLFVIFVFSFFLGSFNSSLNYKFDDELVSYADKFVKAEIKVLNIPANTYKEKTKFYGKVKSVVTDDDERKLINAKSVINVIDNYDKYKSIKIGDTLIIKGKLKVPSNAQNPSQFDYAKYLQYKKTFSVIYVQKDDWNIKSEADDIKGKFLRILNDKRNDIINIHAQNIKSPMLEILGGIIFGDDAISPDEDTKNSFINSGIFHILAASGMNVTLILGIWLFCARICRLNYKFSLFSGILLILFYTCMTGFGPPIIRASLMLTLILIGKLIDRSSSTISILFLVAFLMLLVNPLMIFDIGFQLSFIVTFALILTTPLFEFNFRYKFLNYILASCIIPIIAQFYAAPLQMYYFNTFTVYSVLTNICIIPVLSIVSFVGFISSLIALISFFSEKICYFTDIILNPLLSYIVSVANFFSDLPFSILFIKKPLEIQIILYFVILIFLTCIFRYKLFNKNNYIVLSILIISFLFSFVPVRNNIPEIIFFSVGNADSILIKSHKNEYFLIDTGKQPYLSLNSQAKNIIIKYLKNRGINELNSLILTHFDSDHSGGTIDVLDNLKVKNIYLTETSENTKLSNKIFEYINANHLSPIIVDGESNIYNDDDFSLSIIKPQGGLIKSENQKSLILLCRYKNYKILLMGDGDVNSYKSLPDKFKKNVTIIKSGHHGAKDTVNQEMIDNSDLFVISTGLNIYNHPHEETLKIFEENNKRYLRTDYNNAVKITLDKNDYKIYLFSPKKHKFIIKKEP